MSSDLAQMMVRLRSAEQEIQGLKAQMALMFNMIGNAGAAIAALAEEFDRRLPEEGEELLVKGGVYRAPSETPQLDVLALKASQPSD